MSFISTLICVWLILTPLKCYARYLTQQTHAQPCTRAKDRRGLNWAKPEKTTCQVYKPDDFQCGVCGRPSYEYFDWIRYVNSYTWMPDIQPRCRHIFNLIKKEDEILPIVPKDQQDLRKDFQGVYGSAVNTGGVWANNHENCFLREGCNMNGTWTKYSDDYTAGCYGTKCVNGYGTPICRCHRNATGYSDTYGQRCEHNRTEGDTVRYGQGVQVFVNPLIQATKEFSIVVTTEYEGTGFFFVITTKVGKDKKWGSTPISRRRGEFANICKSSTFLNGSCVDFTKSASALYLTKMAPPPIIKDVEDLHFYAESQTKHYPIGYEERIHVEAYNTKDVGKYINDYSSLKAIFQTDLVVFVEYPVQIHCHKVVLIECEEPQRKVKSYVSKDPVVLFGQISDNDDWRLDVKYENEGDKLKCTEKQYASTHWKLMKIMPDGTKKLLKELKLQDEFVFPIPPFTLDAGGLYEVNFIYSGFTNQEAISNVGVCMLDVFAPGIQAIIEGGYERYVDIDTLVFVDATQSYDPSAKAGESKQGLEFRWSCFIVETGKPCFVETLAGTYKSTRPNVVQIQPYALRVLTTYNLTLTVSKLGKGSGSTYQLLTAGKGPISSISIVCVNCVWHPRIGAVANSDHEIYLRLDIVWKTSDTQVDLDVYTFVWSYKKFGDEQMTSADDVQGPNTNKQLFEVRKNTLVKRKTYFFSAKNTEGLYKATTKFYTASVEEPVCEWQPRSGIRGVTVFKIICLFTNNIQEDYTFEFYDKSKSDEDYFSGRMLGSGKSLKPVRLTNGVLTIYTFTALKMFNKVEYEIELSPFNETAQYVRDMFDSTSDMTFLQSYRTVMVSTTLLSDILITGTDKKTQLKKLVGYLHGVKLYDSGDMKLCLSSLNYILTKLRNYIFRSDVEHILAKQTADILLKIVLLLSKALLYKNEEYTIFNPMVETIHDTILKLADEVIFQTRPNKVVELINPKVTETMANSTEITMTVLEYFGYYLLNRQIEDSDAKKKKSEHVTVWVKTNTLDVWLSDKKSGRRDCPVEVPEESVDLPLNTTIVIGTHVAHLKPTPFWWSKVDITTEVFLIEVCESFNDSICRKLPHRTRRPFQIEFDIANTIRHLKALEGKTSINDPSSNFEEIDFSVTVYRLDPPARSKIFAELMCIDSDKAFKVLLITNLRPDYPMIEAYGSILSCQTGKKIEIIEKNHQDEFVYMGIIPFGQSTSLEVAHDFKFLLFHAVCYHWDEWQWGSYSCRVGNKTDWYSLHCDCTHLSTFAGSVAVPILEEAFDESFLFLPIEEQNWLLALLLLLIILIIYVLLLLWARWRDRKDLKAKDVIVLVDNYPGEKYAFLVGVFTGSRLNASCNANVGVKLYGEQNQSRAHILKGEDKQDFQGNSDNWFLLYCPEPLGTLDSLQLWHDNSGTSPDWFVESIVVIDLKEKLEYYFELNVWIALEVNEYPEVVVTPSTLEEYFSFKRVFMNNVVTGLRDTHYWASILWKHPRNPVTRVQRVNVVMVFTMVALLTSLVLFYTAYRRSELQEDIPFYEITRTDGIIAVISLVVSIAAAFIVMFIIRKSYSRDFQRRKSTVYMRSSEEARSSHLPSLTISELERQYINVPKSRWNDKFVRYGIRSKPSYARTTFQNCGVAMHSVMHGSPLEYVKLPQYKSNLKVDRRLYIASWVIVAIIILSTIITVLVLSIRLPANIGNKFLTIFILVVLFDVIVFSTLKIFLFSTILSLMFLRLLPCPNYNVKPKDGMRKDLVGDVDHLNYLADLRSQPMYCPLSEQLKDFYRAKRMNIMHWKLLVDFVVLVVCVFILVLLNNSKIRSDYFVNSHAEAVLTKGHDMKHPNFHDVYNRTTFEAFLRRNLFPQLYKFLWYNMEDPLEPEFFSARRQSWVDDCVSKLLGNGRIRQVKVRIGECSWVNYVEEMRKYCAPAWDPGVEDQDVYSLGWKRATYEDTSHERTAWRYTDSEDSGSSEIIGDTRTTYPEGGYIMDLGYVKEVTLDAIAEVVKQDWLDHTTRAVFLEMTLINVNTGLLSQVILVSEQMFTGEYLEKSQADSFPMEMTVGVWNIVFGVLLVFFLVRMFILMNRYGILVYLSSLINIYEVFLIALGFTTVILYFVFTNLFSDHIKSFQRAGIDTFFSFSGIISFLTWSNGLMAFLFLFLVGRVLLSWRFGRIYYTFFYTFTLSLSWIVWLMLYFNVLFVVIWRMVGYLLNIHIYPYYTTFLIYYNEYEYFTGTVGRYKVLAYILCLLSYFNILAFVASFLYYYRVAKVHKLISTDAFNLFGFTYRKIRRRFKKAKKKLNKKRKSKHKKSETPRTS